MIRLFTREHYTDVRGKRQHPSAVIMRTTGGMLINCIGGAWRWQGPYPGRTWDEYFDKDLPKYQKVLDHWFEIPALTLGPSTEWCRTRIKLGDQTIAEACLDSRLDYKHCSKSCWFLATVNAIHNTIEYEEKLQDEDPTLERSRKIDDLCVQYTRFCLAFQNEVAC